MSTTLALWKPYGVLTKFTDVEGRPTLADFVKVPGVYAAGRLDLDSEGLLILTDDGGINARLTQPKFGHPRTYLAQVENIPSADSLAELARGVVLSDGPTRPALVELLPNDPELPPRPVPIRYRAAIPTAWIRLTITEGRNRQVRRMTAAVGHPTLRLVRWAIGGLTLEGLRPGEWKPLSALEIKDMLGNRKQGLA